jgi:aminoglycoside phosphotransferase (APT) family kinase protein
MPEPLRHLVAEAIKVPPETVRITLRRPLEHQNNRLYDIWAGERHLIAKEYMRFREFPEGPLREYRSLQLAAPLDIAPQPVLFEPATHNGLGPIVVYAWMDGEMWDRRRPTGQLGQLARLWLRMNAAPTENVWSSRDHHNTASHIAARTDTWLRAYAAWVEAAFPQGRRAVDLCFHLFEARRRIVVDLEQRKPVFCFCHPDHRFANVIQRPNGQLGLVDWEHSGWGDPARDLADLITHANQEDLLHWGEWQPFLEPYLAGRAYLDPELGDRMRLYLGLHPLFWLAFLLAKSGVPRAEAGSLAGWTINGMRADDRLRRFLARALAWPEMDFTRQLDNVADVVFFPTCIPGG